MANAIAISNSKAKGKEIIGKIPSKLPWPLAGMYCNNEKFGVPVDVGDDVVAEGISSFTSTSLCFCCYFIEEALNETFYLISRHPFFHSLLEEWAMLKMATLVWVRAVIAMACRACPFSSSLRILRRTFHFLGRNQTNGKNYAALVSRPLDFLTLHILEEFLKKLLPTIDNTVLRLAKANLTPGSDVRPCYFQINFNLNSVITPRIGTLQPSSFNPNLPCRLPIGWYKKIENQSLYLDRKSQNTEISRGAR